MRLKYLIGLIGLIALYNCSSKPAISVLCEKDDKGNYILKWETYPELDNVSVEIFVSENDSVFPSSPILIANSNDYIAVIKNTDDLISNRKYFRIKIGGTVSDIVSNRFFGLDSIQNFRDIGGHITNNNKRVRWGKIYRSGNFFDMTPQDSAEMNILGIKTIIDLRSEDMPQSHYRYRNTNNIRIPIAESGYSSISKKVLDGHFLRGDAIIYSQDIYKDMVNNFTEEYALFFNHLCDEKNYPIVYHCYLGKDQTGLATYFLLRALDVPLDAIEDDYMISGIGIDKSKLLKNADTLSESEQEAITMLTKTDLTYLKYGISCIRKKSGSIENYMLKELQLTPEKRKKLRDILLY